MKTLSEHHLEALDQEELIDLCKILIIENTKLQQKLNNEEKKGAVFRIKYNTDWNWMQKIVFALSIIDKPALTAEIISELERHDDALNYYHDPARSFSTFMSRAVKYGVVIKLKTAGIQGCHYVLPDWCDGGGKLSEKYRMKISILNI